MNAAHCRAYLLRLANTCLKNDWPITQERLGLLAMDGLYLRTEDPENAAKTIGRWCDRYDIDFEREIKRGERS